MPGCPLSAPSPVAPLVDGIPQVERALFVVAHPDDIDFSCAGTVARFTEAGIAVTYLLVTRGDEGGFDAEQDRAAVGPQREAEQRAAAAEVGVSDVRFLDFRDGYVEATLELREAVTRVIRQVRPQVVVTHNPEWNWNAMPANHPDHMAVGEATVRTVYPDARNRFKFTHLLTDEGLEPWTVHELWVVGLEPCDHVVDITAQMPRKIAALRCHASQTADADVDGLLQEWNGGIARRAALGTGRYAEEFRRVLIPM